MPDESGTAAYADNVDVSKKHLFTTICVYGPIPMRAIPDDFFNGCHAVTTICIPSSVERIGSRAFKDCTSLKLVNLARW